MAGKEERIRSARDTTARLDRRRVENAPLEGAAQAAAGEDADLFDWKLIRCHASFVVEGPRRHPVLAMALLLLGIAGSVAALAVLPRTYHSEAKILASRNLVMPALGNPGRAIPNDADAPTRAANETILRRDNLLALMQQTNLLQHWETSRALLARAKDLVSGLFGPVDQDEKRDALVYVLERRLRVWTGDGTIQIEVDWPDAKMAYQLVTLAQQNFLETRHAIEVSTIAEAISILEGHAAVVRGRIDTAMEELRKERDSRKSSAVPRLLLPLVARESKTDAELANVKLMLVAKRRALRDLEEYRQRRLAELQAQLGEQKATYTPAHPVVVATKEAIDSLQKDSPQLASLRREEREMLKQYLGLGGSERDIEAVTSASVHVQMPYQAREVRRERDESENMQYWRTQLELAQQKYESFVSRIEGARIELDSARAAFKYRYSIVRPAEVSKKPSKPKIPLVLGAGVVMGVFLAFAGPALLDLRRRVLVQPWQIERVLGVPLLAELKSSREEAP